MVWAEAEIANTGEKIRSFVKTAIVFIASPPEAYVQQYIFCKKINAKRNESK